MSGLDWEKAAKRRQPKEQYRKPLSRNKRKKIAIQKAKAKAQRARTGSRLLAKAEDAGTVTRNGQTFKVVKLPPKQRRKASGAQSRPET